MLFCTFSRRYYYVLPLLLIGFVIWWSGNQTALFKLRPLAFQKDTGLSKSVLIVIWATGFFKFAERWDPYTKECDKLNCRFTDDRSVVGKADAVLFHLLETDVSDLPPVRHPWQYYIAFNQEPPFKSFGKHLRTNESWKELNGFFNLTWTYRQDSDVVDRRYGTAARLKTYPLPYDHVPNTTKEQLSQIVAGKQKLVAWFVSDCDAPSGRWQLVQELIKYIPVHIYGWCRQQFCRSSHGGNCVPLSCPFDWSSGNASTYSACDWKVTQEYKFYLAFENEVCKDYVTEKFFRIASYVVPIVMQHDHVAPIAPNSFIYSSYIAVDNFTSVKKLADYLLYLDRNPAAYRRYYDWHDTMYMQKERDDLALYELCTRLRTGELPKWKVYENIYDWWNLRARCQGEIGVLLANRGKEPFRMNLD